MVEEMYWGTWEELVLGGAVLRHGTRDWDAVATELRSRTFYPFFFTPQVCKTKYQQLQQRYFGCAGWFEELRKQRVRELKLELEKSQGSIGSLESKLESLKSEKNEENNNAGNTESPPSVGNVARIDFPSIKDGLSGTEETQTDSSPPPPILIEIKAEEGENVTSKENILKKRRGKRKRKECKDQVILPLGDKQESRAENCNNRAQAATHCNHRVEDENVDLMSVLNSIIESENLSVFQKRTDSQRRGRYKKTIRRHMDLNTMRSQISDGTITTAKELYRDLLLLCNNAIVFYSKESREYKAAFSLRDFVTKTFWKNLRVSRKDSGSCSHVPPPPRTMQDSPKVAVEHEKEIIGQGKDVCEAEVPIESTKGIGKKKVDRPVKVGRAGGSKRVETPVSGRKKPRKR